jgi:hypothetical protein
LSWSPAARRTASLAPRRRRRCRSSRRCRACQCGTDPHCIEPIRAEWDAAKYEHQKVWDQLPPADRKRYDDALGRFRACGDAAGLTIWMP